MRRRCRVAAGVLAGLALGGTALGACAGVRNGRALAQQIPSDCPQPPAANHPLELSQRLSKTLREARANLMVHTEHPDYGTVNATLVHARLALLQAMLAEPSHTASPDRVWVARHATSPFLELRVQHGGALARGDTSGVTLIDEAGRRYEILYLTAERDGAESVYRLYYDGPLRTVRRSGLLRVWLSVPSSSTDSPSRLAGRSRPPT